MILKELLKIEPKLKVRADTPDMYMAAAVIDGKVFEIMMHTEDAADKEHPWELMFKVNGSTAITHGGGELEILSAAVAAIKYVIDKRNPKYISFDAAGASRVKLYQRMAKRLKDYKVEYGVITPHSSSNEYPLDPEYTEFVLVRK